jgi:lantibiotic modifying enzyme
VGFDLSAYKTDIDKNLEHIKNNYLQYPVASSSSLYAGAPGIALTLAECITSGLRPHLSSLSEEIYHCLQQSDMSAAGIATGLSGSGIALMACIPVLGKDLLQPLLEQHVHDLLSNQQPDGSWIAPLGGTPQNGLKFTGYSHGVSGIVCFLLSYTQLYEDEHARQAAARGLYWLQRQSFKINNWASWHVHNKTKQTDLGMSEGSAGIALAFLKGYQILDETAYLQLANNILQSCPAHITGRDITLGSGITGVGEVYLEAYNISKNEEWLTRASWIVQMLMHNFRIDKNGACIWFVDQSPIITADLLNGSSGIIHFLLRYLQPEKLKHPLLPV